MFRLTPREQSSLNAFLSKLVRTPSLSTQEGKVAQLLVDELLRVGVTDVRIDRIGNVELVRSVERRMVRPHGGRCCSTTGTWILLASLIERPGTAIPGWG
jgi:acetylornithine deacetylase/succinyl-diaminopimelate desuccinylase-like protein